MRVGLVYVLGLSHTSLEEFENGGLALKTHHMFYVHTTPEEFENGELTLKTHQMFYVTLHRRNLKTENSL